MPEMSRWMSLRSNGVMNVECRTETVSCVILSALRSMSPMRWISSARRLGVARSAAPVRRRHWRPRRSARRGGRTARKTASRAASGRITNRICGPPGISDFVLREVSAIHADRGSVVQARTFPGPPDSHVTVATRQHPHSRGPAEQPARPRPRHSAAPARRRHRRVRLGQVLARLRHGLCRGPAPLRRDVLAVRAAVPRPHGQAAGGPDRGHPARDRDRPDQSRCAPRARPSAR